MPERMDINMNKEMAAALFLSFGVTAVIGPVLIPFLRRLKVGQTEREEGVQSHLKKAGTPTMGGLMILAGFVIGCIPFILRYPAIVPVMVLTLGFGIIGFLDDFLKVVLRRSDGLMPAQKMAGQILVTTIFVVYLWVVDSSRLELRIPFTGGFLLGGMTWKVIGTVLAYLAVIGTVNGVNFTDGLDGLAAGVTSVVAGFLTLAALLLGAGIWPASCAMLGALLAFLLYNAHPAKVFMGDTGSLALGGFVAGCAYMMQMPVFCQTMMIT